MLFSRVAILWMGQQHVRERLPSNRRKACHSEVANESDVTRRDHAKAVYMAPTIVTYRFYCHSPGWLRLRWR
jgi:hypothetical protein